MREERIKLFTHTDMDGAGCAILLKQKSKFASVDIEYCSYKNIDERVNKFIDSADYKLYRMVHITDISINEDTAKKLNHIRAEILINLVDHHIAAMWLNTYPWAMVKTHDENGNKISATRLLAEQLEKFTQEPFAEPFKSLIENIDLYDTWRWNDDTEDGNQYLPPKELNDIFKLLGTKRFMESAINNELYSAPNNLALTLSKERMKILINRLNKDIRISEVNFNGISYSFGYVFSSEDPSEIGLELCKRNPNLDFVVIMDLNDKTVSLRSNKESKINLSDLAKTAGGGGHFNAAGCKLQSMFLDIAMDYLLS